MTKETTETDPAINYEWSITGPQGARFVLYPVTGQHTEEHVIQAKKWLHRNRDVVSMQIRWVKIGDDKPPPEKIPDYIILKELNKELGKKEAYIQELEDTAQKGEVDEKRKRKKEIQSEKLYVSLNDQLKKAQREIVNLRKTISDLIIKLNNTNKP